MYRNIVVYLFMALSMATIFADDSHPILEYIKNGEVIETRAMTDNEYKAYLSLKTLENKIEKLVVPFAKFEHKVELEATLIEEEVASVMKQAMHEASFDKLSDLAALGEVNFAKLNNSLEQLQPLINEVTTMAEEISDSANTFKTSIMKDYSDEEIDHIKILDGEGNKVVIGSKSTTINI